MYKVCQSLIIDDKRKKIHSLSIPYFMTNYNYKIFYGVLAWLNWNLSSEHFTQMYSHVSVESYSLYPFLVYFHFINTM